MSLRMTARAAKRAVSGSSSAVMQTEEMAPQGRQGLLRLRGRRWRHSPKATLHFTLSPGRIWPLLSSWACLLNVNHRARSTFTKNGGKGSFFSISYLTKKRYLKSCSFCEKNMPTLTKNLFCYSAGIDAGAAAGFIVRIRRKHIRGRVVRRRRREATGNR